MRAKAFFLVGVVFAIWSCAGCSRGERAGAGTEGSARATANPLPEPVIVFLGDSLTDGYHLDRSQSYPARIEERIQERGWSARVINAGVSGDTTADGLRRLHALLREHVDVFVLALGINDVFRQTDVPVIQRNLEEILNRTRAHSPGVQFVIAGMKLNRSWDPDYAKDFEAMYRTVAEKHHAVFVPFLLKGVAGKASLNLPDGIHPTAKGHAVIAENMWSYLEPILDDMIRP